MRKNGVRLLEFLITIQILQEGSFDQVFASHRSAPKPGGMLVSEKKRPHTIILAVKLPALNNTPVKFLIQYQPYGLLLPKLALSEKEEYATLSGLSDFKTFLEEKIHHGDRILSWTQCGTAIASYVSETQLAS